MEINGSNSLAENFGGNPPIIELPIGVIAEAIHQRILAEETRLHAEEKNERELTTKRIALLTEGTDSDVDATEVAIDQSRGTQIRSLERIELLAEQLKQANRTAETQRLDELTAIAERARAAGMKILTAVYPSLAKKLGTALAELRQHQQTIVDANRELLAAKRETVELADKERFSIEGPQGLSIAVVPLHEFVVLPGETADTPNYYTPHDVRHEHSMLTIGVLGMRNGNLLVK
jgi:hypothetical protein